MCVFIYINIHIVIVLQAMATGFGFSMNMSTSSLHIILHFLLVLSCVEAQANMGGTTQDSVNNFQPSLGVVIGILCIMFAVTFILLIYAKFCHRGASAEENRPGLIRSASRFSGIDKTVIESLPFFRFSSLRGSKEGLECAVCLSKFEDIEILRLLPKCKHAFHVNCVDQWLEKHSSCPLCRHKVSAEDPTIFTYSNSARFLWNQSELREDSNVELFVQREENRQGGSSRFSIGSSFRKFGKAADNKEEGSLLGEEIEPEGSNDGKRILHKHNHMIIVSDVVFKNRWSNVSSSDLMFLSSEMLHDMSSNRFSSVVDPNSVQTTTTREIEDEQIFKIKEEMGMKRLFESKVHSMNNNKNSTSFSTAPAPQGPIVTGLASTSSSEMASTNTPRIITSSDRRSVSEITALSRFRNLNIKNLLGDNGGNVQEERQRRLWLPIARRTAQWFANRETRSASHQQTDGNTKQTLDV